MSDPIIAARKTRDALPGLKADEISELGPCAICGEALLNGSLPLFYRVRIEHCGFDSDALRKHAGLAMQIGNERLARIMGTDADLAKIIDGPRTRAVHETCAAKIDHLIRLMETDTP